MRTACIAATAIAERDAKPGKPTEYTYFKDQPRIDREITLYLPLYMPVKVLGIGAGCGSARSTRQAVRGERARGFLWYVDHAGRLRQPARA